ncbi:hypothetical protein RRG08_060437 [Elysia crispata]|uniref:Uncharacterized protein n=1 Tax=Elysia crispata TaxID=231223 RepID=A0AAE1E0M1_9GAST|nr:hypothetical protein RRG08_060437 [Elysia crispata]
MTSILTEDLLRRAGILQDFEKSPFTPAHLSLSAAGPARLSCALGTVTSTRCRWQGKRLSVGATPERLIDCNPVTIQSCGALTILMVIPLMLPHICL